jgi:casein kinase 1
MLFHALTAQCDARPYFYAFCWYTVGVPQVHHFGQEGLHNVLAIDLLGPNLEDLFDMCSRKFSIKTVCMAAKQMVSPKSSNDWSFLARYSRPLF